MAKKIIYILIVAIPLIMLSILFFSPRGFENFFRQLSKLSIRWLLLAAILMLLYWSFEAMAIHSISHSYNIKKRFRDSFSSVMVAQFFNSVTPFAAGGQPAQVFYMVRNGIDTGSASSIVMVRFLVYQSILTMYSFVVMLFSYNYFRHKINLLFTMSVLGLSVHASMIIFTILFSYNRTLTHKIINFVFTILKKVRIVKRVEEAEKKIEDSLANFHDNAYMLKEYPQLLFKTALLIFLQLTCFFSIPFFIYLSFGFSGTSFFYLFSAAVFIATVISIVPLPGSAGGAEGGFYLFFGLFFSGNAIVLAILLWRIITYYSCIGVGVFFTVIPSKRRTDKKECRTT